MSAGAPGPREKMVLGLFLALPLLVSADPAWDQAQEIVSQMMATEKYSILNGIGWPNRNQLPSMTTSPLLCLSAVIFVMPLSGLRLSVGSLKLPPYQMSTGYYIGNTVPIPRLKIPSINMQDAAQGFRTTDRRIIGQVPLA